MTVLIPRLPTFRVAPPQTHPTVLSSGRGGKQQRRPTFQYDRAHRSGSISLSGPLPLGWGEVFPLRLQELIKDHVLKQAVANLASVASFEMMCPPAGAAAR